MQELSLFRQFLYNLFSTIVQFCFWVGLLWYACKWLPVAIVAVMKGIA
ncbi:unnamed protein product [marine sediment metagenome]|uniref:Uncharacterized protein n=1 Tax=marine sediment metagenome TaxID=412755 RepID=X0UDW1_9ZZZZ